MVSRLLFNPLLRNILGFVALLAVHFVSDQYYFQQRTGFNKASPYLFLVLMYGWIVFHNSTLFERLYLSGKKVQYFLWTMLCMGIASLNMHATLQYAFDVGYTLPHIVSFWVYTLAGLGVFVMFRYLDPHKEVRTNSPDSNESMPTHFSCVADGIKQDIPLDDILYIESLENYVKVITAQKSHLPRLSLKEAEDRLPKPRFIRISRSYIVNSRHINFTPPDTIRIRNQDLKIGKVYKRYVEEQMALLRQRSNP